MNDNGPRNPDALFWFGNERAATLINYTNGQSSGLIIEREGVYTVQLYMSVWRRFVLWRTLNKAQREGVSFLGGVYYQRQFQRMGDAIRQTDRLLQKSGAIYRRTSSYERYYFVMSIVFGQL